MEFQNSQTFINLARSFAGESQAGMRYQLIAKQATAEGYAVLADNIRTIAKNETYHAKTFFNTILQNAGSIDNVDLQNAGYPFHFGTLEENLKFAAEDERAEFEEIYAAFANVAKRRRFSRRGGYLQYGRRRRKGTQYYFQIFTRSVQNEYSL